MYYMIPCTTNHLEKHKSNIRFINGHGTTFECLAGLALWSCLQAALQAPWLGRLLVSLHHHPCFPPLCCAGTQAHWDVAPAEHNISACSGHGVLSLLPCLSKITNTSARISGEGQRNLQHEAVSRHCVQQPGEHPERYSQCTRKWRLESCHPA